MAPKSQTAAATMDSPALPSTTAASSKDGSEVPTPTQQSRNSSPSSNSVAPSRKPDSDTLTSAKGASPVQPTAKSSSTSSAADAKDAAGTGPSPYGTRSRNRTGRARPNYAEDKDFDMDFENYPDRKDDPDAKKSTRQSNGPTIPSEVPRTAVPSTRKPLPNGDGAKQAAAAKDQPQQNGQTGAPAPSSSTVAPGTNTTAATTTTSQASKKRKAGTQSGVGNVNQPQSNTAHPPAASASSLKKSAGGALTGYAESNMMSFDNCKGRPINDTLVADDGTTLAVNGKPCRCLYIDLMLFD